METFLSDKKILKSFKVAFRFNDFFQPGIYTIINTQTNIYYIGEAGNLAHRLSHHFSQLNIGKHECIKLQEDWKLYREEVFDFVILEMGINPWSDRIQRLQAERKYIQKFKNKIYNTISTREIQKTSNSSQPLNSIPVIINNQKFNSVSEAARHFGG